jgi:hypothetical protein
MAGFTSSVPALFFSLIHLVEHHTALPLPFPFLLPVV